MIDLLLGVIEILKSDTAVMTLTGGKIYGEKIAREEVGNMPIKTIAVKSAGGFERNQTATTISRRFDIICYGDTDYEAGVLERAVYDALKAVERKSISGMLVHSATVSGGPVPYNDPDTGWPAMVRTTSVLADERIIV